MLCHPPQHSIRVRLNASISRAPGAIYHAIGQLRRYLGRVGDPPYSTHVALLPVRQSRYLHLTVAGTDRRTSHRLMGFSSRTTGHVSSTRPPPSGGAPLRLIVNASPSAQTGVDVWTVVCSVTHLGRCRKVRALAASLNGASPRQSRCRHW
jgi:hypothetical protein